MLTRVLLEGSARRTIGLKSRDNPRVILVTFVQGESLPDGDLYAIAVSDGVQILLGLHEATGDDGVVKIAATVFPADMEEFGTRTWAVEFGTLVGGLGLLDGGLGSHGTGTAYVMFEGSVVYAQVPPKVIASTTILEATGEA